MIDVELVCGYLGAGKTTWLAHRLRHGGDLVRATVIVNDFAAVGVDIGAFDHGAGDRIAVSGGCVCCDKREELAQLLRAEVDRHHRTGERRESHHVIIEASGVTQPGPILELLQNDPILRASVRRLQVTALVDGIEGAAALRHRLEVRAAVRAADRVIVSRADLSDVQRLAEVAGLVRGLAPEAPIATSALGRERPWTLDVAPEPISDEEADAPVYSSWTVSLAPGTRWSELALWLHAVTRAHPDEMVRVKGIVQTDLAVVAVNTMGRIVDVRSAEPGEGPVGVLTSVLRNLAPEVVARSFAHFVPSSGVPGATESASS